MNQPLYGPSMVQIWPLTNLQACLPLQGRHFAHSAGLRQPASMMPQTSVAEKLLCEPTAPLQFLATYSKRTELRYRERRQR